MNHCCFQAGSQIIQIVKNPDDETNQAAVSDLVVADDGNYSWNNTGVSEGIAGKSKDSETFIVITYKTSLCKEIGHTYS